MDPYAVSESIYRQLMKLSQAPPPRLRFWDGSEIGPSTAPATLVLRHQGAFRSMLIPPNDLSAGEAYVFDDIDIEGDIFAMLEFAAGLDQSARSRMSAIRSLALAMQLPDDTRRAPEHRRFEGRAHSKGRDRATVRYHYDTGNEFFQTFLDERMVYSCAHFLDPAESLDTAQQRKLDLICRKLGLSEGQRFLDVGCGWGGLVIHAAERYGAHATGITLSSEQAQLARIRVKEKDLEDRVEILELDYRDITGAFDAIASVGMFEHVGKAQLATYFEKLRSVLAPAGLLLNHGITNRNRDMRRRRSDSFVGRYVFPDGDLRPVEESIEIAERAGFELRDVEAMRMSYALTLRHWVERLESNRELAVEYSSERTYRVWRAYMAGSAIAFEQGAIGLYQLLLSDPTRPWRYGRAQYLTVDDTGGNADLVVDLTSDSLRHATPRSPHT
jgi:cyclopropane-fatty-acyl-phospholipid synthase